MAESNAERLKRWLATGEAALYPATLPQRELWEASPVPPGHQSNNICTVSRIKGAVSKDIAKEALKMVVARQEVLRLSILPGKAGPLQLVRKSREPAFTIDVQDGLSPEGVEELIDSLIEKPFDLVGGPLYRVHVIRPEPGLHVLVLVIHHSIGDGWSLGAFMTDLWTSFAMLTLAVPNAELEALPLSYTGWGATDRAFYTPAEIARRKEYWLPFLKGSSRVFDAPEADLETFIKRSRYTVEVPGELFESLRETAASCSATLFSTVLTAFQIVLARATGKTDILVGSPIAQRSKKNVFETMGSFAGVVPLRGELTADSTLREHIRKTDEMTSSCFANALPFGELVKAIGEPVTPGKNPIFDVRFALQNHPMPDVNLPGMEVDYRTRSTGTCRFDIACELTEVGKSMEIVWIYRDDTFTRPQVEKLHGEFLSQLESLSNILEVPIVEFVSPIPL